MNSTTTNIQHLTSPQKCREFPFDSIDKHYSPLIVY